MKHILILAIIHLTFVSCNKHIDKEYIKDEVFRTEKAFEQMAADSGIAHAFYTFAAENAVILRGKDSIINGRESINHFYSRTDNKNTSVKWTPDCIDVSEDGTMASTFGRYCWEIKQSDGTIKQLKGIFHTVWKKQPNGKWKYIWD
jgi:ketosteroid isomerase-like protein